MISTALPRLRLPCRPFLQHTFAVSPTTLVIVTSSLQQSELQEALLSRSRRNEASWPDVSYVSVSLGSGLLSVSSPVRPSLSMGCGASTALALTEHTDSILSRYQLTAPEISKSYQLFLKLQEKANRSKTPLQLKLHGNKSVVHLHEFRAVFAIPHSALCEHLMDVADAKEAGEFSFPEFLELVTTLAIMTSDQLMACQAAAEMTRALEQATALPLCVLMVMLMLCSTASPCCVRSRLSRLPCGRDGLPGDGQLTAHRLRYLLLLSAAHSPAMLLCLLGRLRQLPV